jgi:hypothetical protein
MKFMVSGRAMCARAKVVSERNRCGTLLTVAKFAWFIFFVTQRREGLDEN